MNLTLYTYNSNSLNTATYTTTIAENSPLFARADYEEIERAGTWGKRGNKRYKGHVMILQIAVAGGTSIGTALDTIGQWFNEEDNSIYQLIAKDSNNSDKQYYVEAEALGITDWKGNIIFVALHVPEPVWKSVTLYSSSRSVTATDQTLNVAVAGNRNARPIITITTNTARTGSYGYMGYVAIANRTTRIYKDAINLPDANWDTATLVSGGKMQSAGQDCRVFNDETGQEEFRWFGGGGINSATTRVFANVILAPKIEMTLSGAISNVGAVTTITVKNTAANNAALRALQSVSYKFVAIDMGSGTFEIFKFTGVNLTTRQLTGCTRAQKSTTTNQSHSDGATIRHIHGYYIMYGNSTASAPSVDDGFKPIIDLSNSTNSSHVYASFYDAINPNRTCMFVPAITTNVGGLSELYTATQDTFADEATVIGAAGKVYKVGTAIRAPSFNMSWSLYHPAGITTLTWSGLKYRYTTSWPTVVAQKSNDGKSWANIAAVEVKPTNTNTWEALSSHSSVSLVTTFLNIRFLMSGTCSAVLNNMVAHEVSDCTVALDTNNTPLINFGAEQTNNYIEPRITNNNTGQYLEIAAGVPLGTSIVIDCDALTVTKTDGTSVPVKLDDESRPDWLPLLPNVTNVLKYTESGVVNETFKVEWRDRNN